MRARRSKLTKEERDVLILAAPHPCGQHLNNTEIGQRLYISPTRVKTLIHQACVKLSARSRNEAVFLAIRRREIRIDEIWSLDELADIFSAVCPDVFMARGELGHDHRPMKDEQIIHIDRRQNTILTKSERYALILSGRGLTNREIADTLSISINSVKTFLYRACTKLGVNNRSVALMSALKQGEISADEMFSHNELPQYLAPLGDESLEKIAQLVNQKLEQ